MARPYKILRDELRRFEITQQDLAEELGVGTDTISRKMNGRYPWTSDQMYAILDLICEKEENLHKIFPRGGKNESDVVKIRRKRVNTGL